MRGRTIEERGGIEILEAAFHLLRRTPAGAFAAFYLGSAPFVLAILFFVSDMSRGAFARRYAGEAALATALFYVWMKIWQGFFARSMRAGLSGGPPGAARGDPAGASPRVRLRHALTQVIVQPSSLFVLPVAGLLTIPLAWVYAFYQSVAVTGEVRSARRHAALWPAQNHVLLTLLVLMTGVVFLNVAIGVAMIPWLLKALLAIDTPFSRDPMAILNTTFFAVVCGLTYLAVAPLSRTVYALRCFHADALRTGDDIRREFSEAANLQARPQGAGAAGRAGAFALALLVGFAPGGPGAAAAAASRPRAEGAVAGRTTAIAPAELDQAIRRVIERREFAWRLPREAAESATDRGILARFYDAVVGTIAGWARGVGRHLGRLGEWIGRWLDRLLRRDETPSEAPQASPGIETLVIGLALALLTGLGLLAWRMRGRRGREVVHGVAVAPVPDLDAEDSLAAAVPADEWLERAHSMWRRGEARMAVRALYLASLSVLARQELLTLAHFKSNRDYEVELRRRGRSRPELPRLFSENVTMVERVWYGRHDATDDLVRRVFENVDRIRAHAPTA